MGAIARGNARRLGVRFFLLWIACTIGVQHKVGAQEISPSSARMVGVAPSVELEVLDSGGSGQPLLLLAQLGHTAHVYDGWTARLLRDRFRVIAVTRRGYGASSRPATGYDSATLVNDVVAVLDSLGIRRVTVVGHEIGVVEATLLAARQPERVERLVFLGPAVDFKAYIAELGRRNAPAMPEPGIGAYDQETVAGFVLLAERTSGPAFPESEVRAMFQFGPDGIITGRNAYDGASAAIVAGLESLDGITVSAPALDIDIGATPIEVAYPYWREMDAGEQAYARQLVKMQREIGDMLRTTFRRSVPELKTVRIDGARRYLFLTHPGDVTHELLSFVAGSK